MVPSKERIRRWIKFKERRMSWERIIGIIKNPNDLLSTISNPRTILDRREKAKVIKRIFYEG